MEYTQELHDSIRKEIQGASEFLKTSVDSDTVVALLDEIDALRGKIEHAIIFLRTTLDGRLTQGEVWELIEVLEGVTK